jgi:hypothetical protein
LQKREEIGRREYDYIEIAKQVLVPMFYKESQLGRSVRENDAASKVNFKRELFNSILELVRKVDRGTLTNSDIREKIRKLANGTGVAVGQAQKVVNVYMKYYCLLKEKKNLWEELDCPIDSGIAKAVWENLSPEDKEGLKKQYRLPQEGIPLRFFFFNITKLQNITHPIYEFLQVQLEKMGNGIRLKPDIEWTAPLWLDRQG